MSTVLVDLIQNRFNSYQSPPEGNPSSSSQRHPSKQNQNDSIRTSSTHTQSIKFQTERLREELIQSYIIQQTTNLSLGNNVNENNANDFQKDVSNTLINVINSVLSTIVTSNLSSQSSFNKSEYYDSSMTLLEHIASFVCTHGDGSLMNDILIHLLPFSSVASFESIRCIICTFVGWCCTNLVESANTNVSKSVAGDTSLTFLTGSNDQINNKEWRLECIDIIITKFLSKRLSDKNQSVRNGAIHSSCLLLSSIVDSSFMNGDDNDDDTNEYVVALLNELVTALMWNMTHDPSFANRSYVLQLFPIENFMNLPSNDDETMETLKTLVVESIVLRVRDDKVKVRLDVFDVLRKMHVEKDLTVEMRCEILRQGFSPRYPATLSAAIKMLCCGWVKTMNFDPFATIALFDPLKNEGIAENVAKAIIATTGILGQDVNPFISEDGTPMESATIVSPDIALMDLSDAEIREFKNKCSDHTTFGLSIKSDKIVDSNATVELSPSKVLYLRMMANMITKSRTLSEVKKSNLLSKVVPDVTTLTDVLEKHMDRLKTIQNCLKDQEDFDEDDISMKELEEKEEAECFICLQLLQLTSSMDLDEEGSRRHLSSIIHRILSSSETHEDLIESCVHLLSAASDSEVSFIQSISEVLVSTTEIVDDMDDNSEEKQTQYIRALEILSITLEKTSRQMSKNPVLQNFSNIILNTISDYSLGSTIRELGIGCLGRFVILMDEETVLEKYKTLLMNITSMEEEKIEIRAQALLAMCDLSLLHERFMAPVVLDSESDNTEIGFADILLNVMTNSTKSLVIIAAEVSVKLMSFGRLHDANIIANLIMLYFDQNLSSGAIDEDSNDIKEVGSPTRLQQLLTMFFPTYCMKFSLGKENLLASVPALLSLLNEKMSLRNSKRKKASTWPIVKIIDYIIDLVETESDTKTSKEESNTSPMLDVSLSISSFLVKESDNLSTQFIRSLCKILSSVDLDTSGENQIALKPLKLNLDELSMSLTDETALRSLRSLLSELDEVKCSNEDVGTVSSAEKHHKVSGQACNDISIENIEDSRSEANSKVIDSKSLEESKNRSRKCKNQQKVTVIESSSESELSDSYDCSSSSSSLDDSFDV